MIKTLELRSLILAIGLALIGCSKAEEPIVATTPAAPVPAAVATNAQSVGTSTAMNQQKSPDIAESGKTSATVAGYTPPFPNRLELFEPPQRAQGTTRRADEHGETIELKGFIYVDEPRVVLSIDGVVSSVPEGGEKYGVQVISIEPPTVVLQRGRDRWPATLE